MTTRTISVTAQDTAEPLPYNNKYIVKTMDRLDQMASILITTTWTSLLCNTFLTNVANVDGLCDEVVLHGFNIVLKFMEGRAIVQLHGHQGGHIEGLSLRERYRGRSGYVTLSTWSLALLPCSREYKYRPG